MRTAGEAMVGQIPGTKNPPFPPFPLQDYVAVVNHLYPGLQSFQMGGVLASTAHRAQGFDMGIMAVLDTEQSVLDYASHPAHLVVHKIREGLCTDTLVYDMTV